MKFAVVRVRYQDRGGLVRESVDLQVPVETWRDPEDHSDVQEVVAYLESRWTGGTVIVGVSSEDGGAS
jgi:hypothetical protein